MARVSTVFAKPFEEESEEKESLICCHSCQGFCNCLEKPVHNHFPDSSVGEESACNAGHPGLIPGWGRSAREGIGYPPHYSWASQVVQLVENLPAMWETWIRSLGWEDSMEKGTAIHSSILDWRIP